MSLTSRSVRRVGQIAGGCVLAVGLGVGAVVLPAGGDEAPHPDRFVGVVPEPPRQHEPWNPPATTLPKFLVDATRSLFDQGLADPRGGEYRSVEVVTGSVWGGQGSAVKRRGWVFPAARPDATRFVVLWDGMVYPLVAVGPPLDLAADVATMARSGVVDSKFNEAHAGLRIVGEEGAEAGYNPIDPLGMALLLRLGCGDLADKLWDSLTKIPEDARPIRRMGQAPPPDIDLYTYGTMAVDLAWYHFDRAVCALQRGDDGVVLHDARFLTEFAPAVEAKAAALGIERPMSYRQGETMTYIGFLDQLPALLDDAERRAVEPKRPPIPPAGGPDQAARIAALIRDLDQIRVQQWGQPGGVSLGQGATVQALIAEGDAAVEPLIATLRTDHRLTRSVSFFRDFHRSRTLLTVDDAAYSALAGILHTSTFVGGTTSDNLSARGQKTRDQVANQIQAYWNRYKGFPLVERWYQVLANDQVPAAGWVEAARNIVQAENVRIVPSSSAFTSTVTTELPPGERTRLQGETLRVGHEPTVSALMARRAESLGRDGQVNPAIALAGSLQVWDRPAALPTLQGVSRLIRTQYVDGKDDPAWAKQNLVMALAKFTVDRVTLSDPTAAREYVDLIRTTRPETFETKPLDTLAPFFRLPDDPTLQAAADALFNDPESPWANLFQPGRRFSFQKHLELLHSPLVRVAGWRRAIETALGDRTEVGTVRLGPDQQVSIELKSGTHMGMSNQRTDPLALAQQAPTPLRVADQVASELVKLDGCPDFQPFWPEARREAAITAIRVYLDRFGTRFVPDKPPGDRTIDHNQTAWLAFPPLDHPASAAEVADDRAIFTLDRPDGPPVERRVVPLLARPLAARWTALRDYPMVVRYSGMDGKTSEENTFEQEGQVWQAEEALEGGRWRRYYGFVGSHRIARVPAEEVEFAEPFGFGRSQPDGWDVLFDLTAVPGSRYVWPPPPILPAGGKPALATIQLRNRTGLDRSLPAQLVRTEGERTVALANSLALKLESAPPLPGNRARPFGAWDEGDWSEIPLKAAVGRFDPDGPVLSLRPTEKSPVWPVNLTDLFGIGQPGRYRFLVHYNSAPGGIHPKHEYLYFNIVLPTDLPAAGSTGLFSEAP